MLRVSMCSYCKHRIAPTRTCTAFPDGIPREIFFARKQHFEPVEGDYGIQFKPADNLSAAEQDLVDKMLQIHGPAGK